MLRYDPFLEPSHRLPTLELYRDLVGNYVFEEVQEDLSLHGVTREIEGTIDRDEDCCHRAEIRLYQG